LRLRTLSLASLLALSVAFAAIASGSARADDTQAPADVVEEVRYGVANGLVVEHHVLIDRSVVADPAGAADALTGISASESTVTAQYVLNSWRWPASAIPVPVSYNPAGAGTLPSAEPWIKDAADQWSGITTAFRFTYAGTTTADLGACGGGDGTPDGKNTIGFTKGMERGVLGQTCTLSTNAGRLVEFDMQLNADATWGTSSPISGSQYDLPSTVLHEMGHAAALGHSADSVAVMYRAIGRGQMKRTLQPDDIAGLKAQYPGGAPLPTPAPPPTPVSLPPYNRNFEVFTVGVAHD